MPKVVRRRSAPATHQVASGEADAEMYDKAESDLSYAKDLVAWLKAEKMKTRMGRGRG